MSFNRAEEVDQNFARFVRSWDGAPERHPPGELSDATMLELFESQLITRHLDLAARKLRADNASFYTIGSCGHEGNVVLGDVVRHSDPSFLHYRSAAFMVQRSRKVSGIDIVRDTLLSVMASADDPISGGRHKVWGSRPLWVPPQTSTIASHLPKAVGAAMAIDRGHRLELVNDPPRDGIVLCSFGDASCNHSTAQGAFNAASWVVFQSLPLPIVFVCEDNGVGISVPTPPGWIEASMRARSGIKYMSTNGLDIVEAHRVADEAVRYVRERRRPVFLHLHVTRLLGHAGSDIEHEYRSLAEIKQAESLDPILATARHVLSRGLATADQLVEQYESVRTRVEVTAQDLRPRPRLRTVPEIMAPLAPFSPEKVQAEATRVCGANEGTRAPLGRQRHLAGLINRGLHEALGKYPETLVFGEDVAKKGGVYHVTTNLLKRYGPGRVFNTILDEQGILGLAIGAAHLGFLPIPEIQDLAYYHNAEDQLRGEACSLQFFSKGQFSNPMLVRIASFAYQKGFGGHFHNDNSIAALRDIPGVVLATPARGDDAVKMLRTCLALAKVDGRVVVFLEPIALYMTKDLHEDGDGLWLNDMPAEGEAIAVGEGRAYHEDAADLTIVSYANGLYLSLQAAADLAKAGIGARVLDLRWLHPLNLDWVYAHARATGKVLVVDECRRAGGLGEAVVAGIAENVGEARVSLHAAVDTYIPLGPAMDLVLPSRGSIAAAARELVAQPASA